MIIADNLESYEVPELPARLKKKIERQKIEKKILTECKIKSVRQLALETGLNEPVVLRVLNLHGLHAVNEHALCRNEIDRRKKIVENHTIKESCKILGLHKATLLGFCKRHNIKFKRERKEWKK